MGVKKLWDILESCKQTLPLHHLQNKRVCIDLSCWLVQIHNASKPHNGSREKLYLRGLFHRLRTLIALNCSLILVADGSIPAIKLSTYRKRLGTECEVLQDGRNSQKTTSLQRNMGSEFSCMIKEAKALGVALGIPCLDGLEEAEAQCALLNSASLCDGCFTADSDALLFGARTVYRDIHLGEGGFVVCYEMADIERKLGFGRNSLITLALLLGGDYSQKIHGVGPEVACKLVRSIDEKNILQRIALEGLAFARKTKGTKKKEGLLSCDADKENEWNSLQTMCSSKKEHESDEYYRQVIEAYLKPKCHLPNSPAVERVLLQYPFQQRELQKICADAFGWTPDKTDEYIVPKIAERDVRRLANLRSLSLALGVQAPYQHIRVGYRIAAIVKPRKVQGKECFEVAWEGDPCLKTSVIPADLVKSAFPEKVEEFMSRKAETKKKNKKPKKMQKESKPTNSESCKIISGIDTQLGELSITPMRPSKKTCMPISIETIDLSTPSPSPPLVKHDAVSCLASTARDIDVINVIETDTETENEVSPEHERKAKELRLFLDSIRTELS
ncbi:hypothetical protein AMTRI_Chr07g31080 [Amborella trichopoda]